VQYERDVVANLRHLQMLGWGREQEAPGLQQLEGVVREELARAREAVDLELEEGRGRPAVVAALRASPQRPESVREYWETEFAELDSRRGSIMETGRVQLGGADYGSRWGLEHPLKRWLCTRWRISWLCEEEKFMFERGDREHSDQGRATCEVYAVELVDARMRSQPPRVWMLGKLSRRESVERALKELTLEAMDERNSLIVAAGNVARAERDEQGGVPH